MNAMHAKRPRLPPDYHRDIPAGPIFDRVNRVVAGEKLETICTSGKCPNRGECFSRGSLAFMILGRICTRHCGFCAVAAGNPGGLIDWEEPARVAEAVRRLALRHAVITCVARDDLDDGGAAVFAATVQAVRGRSPGTIIEVLTSDFAGRSDSIDRVLRAGPDIFNHNLETVERLTPRVRSKAAYRRSLDVLRHARQTAGAVKVKSGMMLGLGESADEVMQALRDLREAGCDYLTIGQYLAPSPRHLPVERFVPTEEFSRWKTAAFDLGFERVASGPLVRSSYFADALHEGAAA